MAASELIESQRRLGVFKRLLRNRTLLRLEHYDDIFQGLTLVVDLCAKKSESFFRIDYLKGFHEAVRGHTEWRFKFEFIDRSNIQYTFATVGGYTRGDEIWIKFPEFIQRNQRRQHFRLTPPRGTTLLIHAEHFKGDMQILDIGMGGALVRMKVGGNDSPLFSIGDTLKDTQLQFPHGLQIPVVMIKKAVVKRFESNGAVGLQHYPLEFVQMDKREKRRLLKVLYHLQRNQLRQRLPLDG